VKVQAHTTLDLFDTLKEEWNALVARSHADTIFTSWEWHYHWWQAYHPGDLWVLSIRTEDDHLVGLASWFIQHDPVRGRVVRHIGCEDVTDYLDVIVDRDCQEPVYQALVDYVDAHAGDFDHFDLCNMPGDSATPELLGRLLSEKGYKTEIRQQDVCPIIPLPEDFEIYLERLDKKQRHEIRRKLRRADGQRQMGDLDWYIVTDEHDLNVEIDHFIRLMAASHPEKAEFLTDDQHTTFFRSIIPAALEKGWLQLNFLRINSEPVAAYLNFDYGNRILVYNSGLDPEQYGHLSPGIVLLAYNIQHAIELGRETFDFLRGDEQYKYRMGAADTAVMNLRVSRNDR